MIIKALPKEEWNKLASYRGYVRRRNNCCCVIGNSKSCCEEQDWLEFKLEACHNGGWNTDADEPVNEDYKKYRVYKEKKNII